jgi:DNA-binding response OmpR family regulator
MENSNGKRLLLVDDNSDYRHAMRIYMELENYIVEEAASVEEAKKKLDRGPFDLMLLDIYLTDETALTDLSGFEVAKKARETQTPCIVVTGHSSIELVRIALNSRSAPPLAVDVIGKSAGPEAVLSAIHVELNKHEENHSSAKSDLEIEIDKRLVFFQGQQMKIPSHQFDLLAYLYRREGGVSSDTELIKAVYGETVSTEDAKSDSRLERLVERTRKKIEVDPARPRHLVTEQGRGYRLILEKYINH